MLWAHQMSSGGQPYRKEILWVEPSPARESPKENSSSPLLPAVSIRYLVRQKDIRGDISQIIFADWKSGRSGGVSIPLARMEAQNRVSKKNPDADLEARVCLLMARVGEGPGWLINEIEARAGIELKAEKLGLTYLLEGKQFTEKPKFKEIEELPANYIIIKVYPDGRAIEEIYIDNELKKRKCLVCHAEAVAGHNCR